MAGFGLEPYEGRVPCPHCQSTDCCGIHEDHLKCCDTDKIVTSEQLRRSAIKHKLVKYRPVPLVKDVYERIKNMEPDDKRFFGRAEDVGWVGDFDTVDECVIALYLRRERRKKTA